MPFADGPRLVITGWVTWTVSLAAFFGAVTALAVFSVKFTRTVVRPAIVLSEIATRFSEGYQETISAELRVLADHGESMAGNQQHMLDRLDQLTVTTNAIDQKLSETRHKIIGEFATLKMGGSTTVSIVEALERTSAKLQSIDEKLRDGTGS